MTRTGLAAVLLCALVLASGDTTQGQRRSDDRVRRARQPIPNQYIVVLNAGEDAGEVGRDAATVHRGRSMRTYRRAMNGFAMQLTPEAAGRLAEDPRVRFVEEDSVISIAQMQTNPPGGLDRIDQRTLPLDGAYAYTELATFVRVHVIDTGVRVSHQEFGGRAFLAGDYVDDDGDGDPSDVGNDDADPATPDGADCHGHGTHVAGTIGGTTYGVAKHVGLYAHRVLNCSGSGSVSGAIAAIEAITADGYRPALVNMSLGGEPSDALDAAVSGAIAQGLTFVVAAGNSLSDASNFSPARVGDAVTVGATDTNDVRAWFSNYGPSLDLFAPGVGVVSAWHTGDEATMSMSGTSMAAPHAAGVVALYLSGDPDLTPAQVHDRLVRAATPNTVVSAGSGSPRRVLYSSLDHLSAPTVTLLGPLAGDRVLAGRAYSINWDASDPDGLEGFDVLLSTDGGGTYAPLGGCTGLDGGQRSCAWAAPGPETTTARVRVVARDLAGDSASDQSEGNFSIVSMPDLVMLDTTHPDARLSPGSSFSATDRIRNDGNTGTGVSTTRYYLSLDPDKGSDDRQLSGGRSVQDLAPGAESAGSAALTVSPSTPPGTYYVLACADAYRLIKELDESNNCAVSPTQLSIEYANLAPTAVSPPPASAAPGTSFPVSDTIQNTSDVTAAGSQVRYYLSADAGKNGSDILLSGTRSVPALPAGTSSSGSRSVSIPSTTPVGSYRLLACADDLSLVEEADESDNCLTAATTVIIALPDLATVAVSHQPAAAAPGSSISVTDTVQNVSTVVSGWANTWYYLSADSVRSPDDVLLTSSRYVSALSGGATSTGTRTVAIPVGTSHGIYRVLTCADATDRVAEADESNNCAASGTTLLVTLPDLLTAAVSHPPSIASPGSAFQVTDTVRNAGHVATGYTTSRYYLSTDSVRSADDVLVTATRYVLGLAPGATSTGSRTITVPAATPQGTYRLLACADDLFKVTESDEVNNCLPSATAMLVAFPDLVVNSLTDPPSAVTPGAAISMTDMVQNIGQAPTVGWSTVRYYLSTDTHWDAGDVRLSASRSIYALAPGATSTGTRTLWMPSTPGAYYVIVCADGDAVVTESEESNNCRVSATPVRVEG